MPGPNYTGLDKGFVPTVAVTQFQVVKIAGQAKEKVALAGAGDQPIGVVQETATTDDATAGRVVNVRLGGISRCIAGGVVAIGDRVKPNASSRVITTTTAGDQIVGIATTAAAADGDWVDVLLTIGDKV